MKQMFNKSFDVETKTLTFSFPSVGGEDDTINIVFESGPSKYLGLVDVIIYHNGEKEYFVSSKKESISIFNNAIDVKHYIDLMKNNY